MRLTTRSGLASVPRLMARGFLGGFGNAGSPSPYPEEHLTFP